MKFGWVLGLALLMPVAAHADWQKTKWGMTPAQVQKVYPSAGPIDDSDSGEETAAEKAELKMPYQTGSLTFTAFFLFDGREKLSMVILHYKGDQSSSIGPELAAKYGKPDVMDADDMVWHTATEKVAFSIVSDQVWIQYSPRSSANNSGL